MDVHFSPWEFGLVCICFWCADFLFESPTYLESWWHSTWLGIWLKSSLFMKGRSKTLVWWNFVLALNFQSDEKTISANYSNVFFANRLEGDFVNLNGRFVYLSKSKSHSLEDWVIWSLLVWIRQNQSRSCGFGQVQVQSQRVRKMVKYSNQIKSKLQVPQFQDEKIKSVQ